MRMACRCRKPCAKASMPWRAISLSRRWIEAMAGNHPVGLVGIGLMGDVYARRLLAAGFSVTGFDVDAARMERLAQIGGRARLIAAHDGGFCPCICAAF